MSPLRIAAAQSHSIRGDIAANLAIHREFVRVAADLGIDYLSFPELSLTGYEPTLAAALAVDAAAAQLRPLQALAIDTGMHIAVGAPLEARPLPQLGLLLLHPDGRISRYAKQHLHPGEEHYFDRGDTPLLLDLSEQRLSHGICADANHPQHAEQSRRHGAQLYLLSALISATGYPQDSARLAAIARRHQMPVLLANHHGPTGGWQPCGRSALWSADSLLAEAPPEGPALVIAEHLEGHWRGQRQRL